MDMNKLNMFRIYLYGVGIFMFVWWVLGHWVYPDLYHGLMGFDSHDLGQTRVIGTLSLFPILGILFVARNPEKNRDFFALFAASAVNLGTSKNLPHN